MPAQLAGSAFDVTTTPSPPHEPTVPTVPTATTQVSASPDDRTDAIRRAAYAFYEGRGCAGGHDD